jgi:FMN phosphatase YigB (HAD superfamily)
MINPFRRWVFPEIETWYHTRVPKERFSFYDVLGREHSRRLRQGRMRDAYDWDDILKTVTRETIGIDPPFTVKELVEKHAVPGKVWRFSDVLPTLNAFRQAGVPMVVASNGFECYQRPVTDCLKLTPFFSAFHTPDRLQTAKPSPDFFRFADPRRIIHVGDRIDQDIVGANRAGAVSVWISRDLPSEIRRLPLSQRKRHPDFPRWISTRLKWEGHSGRITEEHLPDYALASLEELLRVWDEKK